MDESVTVAELRRRLEVAESALKSAQRECERYRSNMLGGLARVPELSADEHLSGSASRASNPDLRAELESTKQALHESESRLQIILEMQSVAALVFNRDGVLTDANDEFLRLTGYTRDDVRSGVLTWQRMTPPEWLEESQRQMDRFFTEGRIGPYEKEYFCKDGSRSWMLFAGRELGGYAIMELGIDITNRKRMEADLRDREERHAFILKLSDALQPLRDAVEIERIGVHMLGRRLKASRIFFAKNDDDVAFVPSQQYTNGACRVIGRSRYSDFGHDALAQLKAGCGHIQADIRNDPTLSDAARKSLAMVAVGAALTVPLIRDGRLLEILNVSYEDAHVYERRECELVAEVAERIWAAAEKARVETALRHSEARLAAAFESVPVGAAVVDLSGTAVLCNAEYRQFLPSGVIPSRDLDRVARWQAWDLQGTPLAHNEFPGARAIRGEASVFGLDMLYLHEDGREVWTKVSAAPTRDERGQVTGAVVAIADIDIAKRATESIRQSEERLRHFGEASQDALWIRDAATLQWTYLTPAFEQIYGVSRDDALQGNHFNGWLTLILAEDRAHAAASVERAKRGVPVTSDYRIRRPSDGKVRWLRNTDFPIRDARGVLKHIGGIAQDFTERRETELRLQVLIEGIPQLVWRGASAGEWQWSSPQWSLYTGLSAKESMGMGWLEAFHPDDRLLARQAWHEAPAKRQLNLEARICRARPHEYRWFQTRATAVCDDDGEISEWLGTCTDIHDIRQLQEQQKVLVAELQHRTRNVMAMVRSIAVKTARLSADLPTFQKHFNDRLDALSRVQGLLSRLDENDRITFDELLRAELAAMDGTLDRIRLQGPAGVPLRASMVQLLAMALHELATNAVKYGALGQPGSLLSISWNVGVQSAGGKPWLYIDWRESGVVMPEPRALTHGGGQGRELIERALPYQLGAKTTYDLGSDGIHCTVAIPITIADSSDEATNV